MYEIEQYKNMLLMFGVAWAVGFFSALTYSFIKISRSDNDKHESSIICKGKHR